MVDAPDSKSGSPKGECRFEPDLRYQQTPCKPARKVGLNPFGSLDHGFEQVAETMERVASQLSDGEVTSFDVLEKYVTPELAYVVWVERSKAKAGGRQDVLPFDLRVTMVFQPEEGTWKVVHRHADSMTMARPIESVIQE